MGAQQRSKGARFERDVAKRLFAELGITFKRDLSQYQQSDRGDLTPDNPAFPFLIECKTRASGADCLAAWEAQAHTAAKAVGLVVHDHVIVGKARDASFRSLGLI